MHDNPFFARMDAVSIVRLAIGAGVTTAVKGETIFDMAEGDRLLIVNRCAVMGTLLFALSDGHAICALGSKGHAAARLPDGFNRH